MMIWRPGFKLKKGVRSAKDMKVRPRDQGSKCSAGTPMVPLSGRPVILCSHFGVSTSFLRFNPASLAFVVLALVLTSGCQSPEHQLKKELATLRVHLEVSASET